MDQAHHAPTNGIDAGLLSWLLVVRFHLGALNGPTDEGYRMSSLKTGFESRRPLQNLWGCRLWVGR